MRKMIFFCFVVFILNPLHVRAVEYEVVMDADSGRVLHANNKDVKRLIASTTKIMTTLVVLNNCKLDEVVEAGDEILDAYSSSIYLKPKERMRVEDMLYGLMMRSGNDAAIALAVHTAGSIEAFADLMNETAKSIGMYNTHFGNPHGLDDEPNNKSTVYDLALLMREAMKNEDFRKITKTKKYITKSNFTTYEWYNKNELLTTYKYATGGKIGYTDKARHTFVSSATKDNKNLIIATFVDPNRFTTHKNLYEEYFSKYEKFTLIDKNNLNIDYKKGYRLFTLESFSMLLNSEEVQDVNREVTLYEDVKVENGATVVGTISISLDGIVYKKLNIYGERTSTQKFSLIEWIKGLFKWLA